MALKLIFCYTFARFKAAENVYLRFDSIRKINNQNLKNGHYKNGSETFSKISDSKISS